MDSCTVRRRLTFSSASLSSGTRTRVVDYNNDGYLDKADLKRTVQTLCNPPSHQFNAQKNLQDDEVELVVDKILAEADLDGDKRLS
jgi:hypothetical protein